MDIKLDWLSFTYNWDNSETEHDGQAKHDADLALLGFLGEGGYNALIPEGEAWTYMKGRKPYSSSLSYDGIRVFFNHKLNHALVEISGTGCTRVFSQPSGVFLLQQVQSRVTRVDIACDIETDVTPGEFVSHRDSTRHKSFQHVQSETGETCYIGSMTSNRYCRVYKYNDPHPRAGLLRVEHVFRQEDAKKVVAFGFENGIDSLAQQCALIYGWSHEAWELEPASQRELKAHRVERTDAATVLWLYDTVIPSIARLCGEDKLDLKAFLSKLYEALTSNDGNTPVDRLTD